MSTPLFRSAPRRTYARHAQRTPVRPLAVVTCIVGVALSAAISFGTGVLIALYGTGVIS